MCLVKPFITTNSNLQTVYELHGFRRVGIYGLIQLILTLIGIFIVFFGEYLFHIQFIYNTIIGAAIIILFNLLPNGRPFFSNLYKMGREYIMFDVVECEIYLISGKLGGCFYRKKLICSYSQFRGIAVHHKTRRILFLCKRTESLLLKQIGDVLPDKNNNKTIENILEEISLFWFSSNNQYDDKCFFGVTYLAFKDGIVAEGNVHVQIDYDYYLKPKYKVDDDQVVYLQNNNDDQQEIQRFDSIQGASVNVESDEEDGTDRRRSVDYV